MDNFVDRFRPVTQSPVPVTKCDAIFDDVVSSLTPGTRVLYLKCKRTRRFHQQILPSPDWNPFVYQQDLAAQDKCTEKKIRKSSKIDLFLARRGLAQAAISRSWARRFLTRE